MSDAVGGVGANRHFTVGDEAGETTNAIVKRDTRIGVDIKGRDATQREVKAAQHEFSAGGGLVGGLDIASTALEGVHLVTHLPRALDVLTTIASPFVAMGVGGYELYEAHQDGEEQAAALTREQAHVAVLAVLDLPPAYKTRRLDVDYASVPKSDHTTAFRMTEALNADPKGKAQLQIQCDRGMNAASAMGLSGMGQDAFLAANPKVATAYAKDAAFHEGFDAYVDASKTLPKSEMDRLRQTVRHGDGWNAQNNVAVRG